MKNALCIRYPRTVLLGIALFCGSIHVVERVAESHAGEGVRTVERAKPRLMFATEGVFIQYPTEHVRSLFGESFDVFGSKLLKDNKNSAWRYGNFGKRAVLGQGIDVFFSRFLEHDRSVVSNFERWSFAGIFYLNQSIKSASRRYVSLKDYLLHANPGSLLLSEYSYILERCIRGDFGGFQRFLQNRKV